MFFLLQNQRTGGKTRFCRSAGGGNDGIGGKAEVVGKKIKG
jgi:hypothetical protein